MALERIFEKTNLFDYADCSGPFSAGDVYGNFCKNGIDYSESVQSVEAWGYDAASDRYRLNTLMTQKRYPSWSYQIRTIHPETGVVESYSYLTNNAVARAWTGEIFSGGLNKLFATYVITGSGSTQGIVEITDKTNFIPTAWQVANPVVNVTQIPKMAGSITGHAICFERDIATIFFPAFGMYTYDISNRPAASTQLAWHPFSEKFCWSVGYEDDQRLWALFADDIWNPSEAARTTLLKYNFFYNRIELVTELQKTTIPDRIAKVAWDSKRKKLGVVRIKQEGGAGVAINSFEVYNPRPAMSQITVPVNIDTMTPGKTTRMITNLLGTKAESGGGFRQVDLTATPAYILTVDHTVTKNNGSAEFEVTPQSPQEIDTITVEYDETKVV